MMINFIKIKKKIYEHGLFPGADTGGAGGHSPPPLTDSGRGVSPPELGIFCSYFQNSFSLACLRERNPSAKQEKYLS